MKPRVPCLGLVVASGLVVAMVGCGSTGDGPSTADGGGPITVEQLVARSADTPVAVRGLLRVEQGLARLCAAILESYPPQCGEPSVELVGLDPSAVEGTTTAEAVTWKEGVVLNLERVAGGRFSVLDMNTELSVRVTLGIYSGVPDPTWTLSTDQADELAAALATLTRVDEPAPTGGLGYHGFTVATADRTLVAYAGKVVSADSEPPYILDDPDRTIERFLLDTAQPHVSAEVLGVVRDSLDQE